MDPVGFVEPESLARLLSGDVSGITLAIGGKRYTTPVYAVSINSAMLDALIAALPYIEEAEKDEAYKPGAVAKITKQIREAIGKAGAK